MNRKITALACLGALSLLGASSVGVAQQEHKPGMHMHKSEMAHRPDKDVGTEYGNEARHLREKAQMHRNMAAHYRAKTPHKSGGNYASVARHCDKLAQSYERAAREADKVASELSR